MDDFWSGISIISWEIQDNECQFPLMQLIHFRLQSPRDNVSLFILRIKKCFPKGKKKNVAVNAFQISI